MRVRPDKNRYRLEGWMNLTASYQKDPKAVRTQPAAVAEAKAKPAASEAKPKPAKPETKPEKTKPAKPETKPSGGRRKVPTRSVPRPVRKTQ